MARHTQIQTHEEADSAGPGERQKTRGHTKYGLLVEAHDFDPEADDLTVRVEYSADGTNFGPVVTDENAVEFVIEGEQLDNPDGNEDGVYMAFNGVDDQPAEWVRANITEFEGDFTVNVFLYLSGWGGPGKSYDRTAKE